MSQKRQPEEGERPQWGGCSGGGQTDLVGSSTGEQHREALHVHRDPHPGSVQISAVHRRNLALLKKLRLYIVVDDDMEGNRGNMVRNKQTFPSGIKALADIPI